jgi:hypothetical protein
MQIDVRLPPARPDGERRMRPTSTALAALLVSISLATFLPAIAPRAARADAAPGRYQRPADVPSDDELEQAGAVVGEIYIDNQNIFNPEYPGENTRIFGLANRLHIKTRAGVVRHQLLFHTGDRYSAHAVAESERILRANRYFYDAWIKPVAWHDGKVDLMVTTRDVWTLNPGFNFGRTGGKNTTGAELEEMNLLGTGTAISLVHREGIDRTESGVEVTNQHALGTWTAVDLNYSDNSDGYLRQFFINKPFYALDVRGAGGLAGTDALQVDSLYDRGQIVDQFQDRGRFLETYGGWSTGLRNGWVHRFTLGATYDEHRFALAPLWTGPNLLPQDRKFVYPWVRYDLIEDDYLKLRNRDQIGRTEDFYLGTTAGIRLGWADRSAGSSRSALLFQTNVGQGIAPSDATTLLLSANFTGRLEDGVLRNGVVNAAMRFYAKQSQHWLFFTTLQGTAGRRLDLDDQILLGGDNGLRGYPLRYQGGDSRALLTIEQRYFSNWYPFRLFRVGGAVFFDAGRTWGNAPLAAPSLGLLKDAGFGLRIGNSRSGLGNVIHVDLAFPFDGDPSIKRIQFLVQTQERF